MCSSIPLMTSTLQRITLCILLLTTYYFQILSMTVIHLSCGSVDTSPPLINCVMLCRFDVWWLCFVVVVWVGARWVGCENEIPCYSLHLSSPILCNYRNSHSDTHYQSIKIWEKIAVCHFTFMADHIFLFILFIKAIIWFFPILHFTICNCYAIYLSSI